MNSYHRFTRDQIETIKDFYIKHRDRKWSDPIKRRDLYDLMQTTDLSERQIYTFCRNKKFRDKNSSIRRTTIWKPLRNILHDMKDLESSPDCQKDIMVSEKVMNSLLPRRRRCCCCLLPKTSLPDSLPLLLLNL
mmetsp:Transcript_64602/g.74195  ORF Transcript_64602/g.74195 Transcript_64602/m.74195 type:complete len:134 (-) Transcript_64602:1026-1427(-)